MLDPARVGFTCMLEEIFFKEVQNELYRLTSQDKSSSFKCGYKSVLPQLSLSQSPIDC